MISSEDQEVSRYGERHVRDNTIYSNTVFGDDFISDRLHEELVSPAPANNSDIEDFEVARIVVVEEKISCYKWVILAVFSGLLINAMVINAGTAVILMQQQRAYGLESLMWPVVSLSTYTILTLPMTPLATKLLSTLKLH